jgi:hypothetical protein
MFTDPAHSQAGQRYRAADVSMKTAAPEVRLRQGGGR